MVVEFDFFMCKFLSGAFGGVVASLHPISNVVLLSGFFMEERAFLMGCWLDVLLVEYSAFVLFLHYFVIISLFESVSQ